MIQQDVQRVAQTGGDLLAGATVGAAIMKWVPPLAAVLTLLWFAIRLYEYVRWVRGGRKGSPGPG